MTLREQDESFGGWSRTFQESMRSSGRSSVKPGVESSAHKVVTDGVWRYRIEPGEDEAYSVLCGYMGCESSVTVPGSLGGVPLKKIAARALSASGITQVELPDTVEELDPAAICSARLDKVIVSSNNAALASDGVAIYSAGFETLLCCPVRIADYAVAAECKTIADSAFKGMTSLTSIKLNAGLESIGSFAFFRTSLTTLVFPSTLKKIREKAFASSKLEAVEFKEGIEDIGSQAFASTKVSAVSLPASLKRLGDKVFWRSLIDYSDDNAFSIDKGNQSLLYEDGLLYGKDAEGLHLVEAIKPQSSCRIADETVQVCSHAFESQSELEEVTFPDGLVLIGERAFASCPKLEKADLPDSLRLVGSEAFYGTALRSVVIGARLTDIGPCAFEVAGDGRLAEKPQIKELIVSDDNPRYRFEDGLLLEKRDAGDRVLLYAGDGGCVHIPSGVVEVAEMAFYNACFDELYVPSTLQKVSQRGFLGSWGFNKVYIEYPGSYEGYGEITVPFPRKPRDRWDYSRALAMNPNGVFLDFEIFDAYAVHELDTDRVVEIALSRLLNPIDLSFASKANYESAVLRYLPHALESFQENGNHEALDALKEYWALNEKAAESAEKLIEEEAPDLIEAFSSLIKEQ